MERQHPTPKQTVARIGLAATAAVLSACGDNLNTGDAVRIRGELQEGLTGGRRVTTICKSEQGELFEINKFGTISNGSAGTETIARVSSLAEPGTTDCASQSGQVYPYQIDPVE